MKLKFYRNPMATSEIKEDAKPASKMRFTRVFANRNFRLLWFGESISVLGDQFYLVALPWLTLQITGSGLALGTVLMAAAIPRSIFMLIGGAVSDRIGPRSLMLLSNFGRIVLVGLLLALVLLNSVQLWLLYILAAGFGIADAFFYPAFTTMLPGLVEEKQLETGNSVMQGTSQLMSLFGPALAGLVIATLGVASAFAFDIASFGISILMLTLMGKGQFKAQASLKETSLESTPDKSTTTPKNGIFAEIRESLHYALGDPIIRVLLLIAAGMNLAFVGPFDVGAVALANQRFEGGASGLGVLFSAAGAGGLAGAVLAGVLGQLRNRGKIIIAVCGFMGFCLILMSVTQNLILAAVIFALAGCSSGFISILAVAWLQGRTEPRQMGRVMSLVMFFSAGLVPISLGISGFVADISLTLLFMAAGLLLLIIAAYGALNRTMRSM